MMIHKITLSVDNNLLIETFGHSTLLTNQSKLNMNSKFVNPTIRRKPYYKTLGISVLNSPMSPPSLVLYGQFEISFEVFPLCSLLYLMSRLATIHQI